MNLERASQVQSRLAQRLKLEPFTDNITLVGGIDCGYDLKRGKICAVATILAYPDLELIESLTTVRALAMPYIPGYLNFREGPVCVQALKKIRCCPQVLLIDGNGIAHPRRMGLASYVGVILGVRTIGCAKSPFYPFTTPGAQKGCSTPYFNRKHEQVGISLRTRTAVKPIFVSPGHLIDLASARDIVLACSRTRIPEPLRQAHHQASRTFRTP